MGPQLVTTDIFGFDVPASLTHECRLKSVLLAFQIRRRSFPPLSSSTGPRDPQSLLDFTEADRMDLAALPLPSRPWGLLAFLGEGLA